LTIELTPVAGHRDIETVARLAKTIWEQHFTPIIGAAQVAYMLDKFQSAEAVAAQIENGWEYYLAHVDNDPVGYMGVVPAPTEGRMMLSKIYVKHPARGIGVGRSMIAFVEKECRSMGCSILWLTVNRFNSNTISWYRHLGFRVVDEVRKNIGEGFYMDDFIMGKSL
jgi:diamine N-acetyltransferase